jgi:murein L,D-transpeptidase YafK
MKLIGGFILALTLMVQQSSFREKQLSNARVQIAYDEKKSAVKQYFTDKKLAFEKFELFLRAFKKEQKLEVWVKENSKEEFVLIHAYDFCAMSGTLGPKRKEGDLQIPEGVYHINHFNPLSNFYLSLGLSYPNASDKLLSHKTKPGGAIYIHGNCVTIGCIPITDEKIKELYVLAVEARNNGQEKIPVYVFPAKLNEGVVEKLATEYAATNTLKKFWKNLEPIYTDFESTKKLRPIKVNDKGEYTW